MAFIGYSKGPIIFKLETKLNAVLKQCYNAIISIKFKNLTFLKNRRRGF